MDIGTVYKNVNIVEFKVVSFFMLDFIFINYCLTAIVFVMEMKMNVGDVKCQR